MFLEIGIETPELLVHQLIRGTAISRGCEMLCEILYVLPHFACSIVLKHHLTDGRIDAATVERLRLTTFIMSLIHLIKIRKEHMFFFREMIVELSKRFFNSRLYRMKFRMPASVHTFNLYNEAEQIFVVEMKVAMMPFQDIVEEKVKGPTREIGDYGTVIAIFKFSEHLIRIEILLAASSGQSITAMAAIVDTKALKNLCLTEIGSHYRAYRHTFVQCPIHNLTLFLKFHFWKNGSEPRQEDLRNHSTAQRGLLYVLLSGYKVTLQTRTRATGLKDCFYIFNRFLR